MVTKFSIVSIHRTIQAGRDVRAELDMGSDQVAQRFIQSCLENLQGQRLSNISGKCALLLECLQGDFPPLL